MEKKREVVIELATEQVRLYPSDYEALKEQADLRRTSIAQIVHELREKCSTLTH